VSLSKPVGLLAVDAVLMLNGWFSGALKIQVTNLD
jgi:hypothetical protein